MGFSVEGKVNIPMEDFWQFAREYLPEGYEQVVFGVPAPTSDGVDIVVTFTASDTGAPLTWDDKLIKMDLNAAAHG